MDKPMPDVFEKLLGHRKAALRADLIMIGEHNRKMLSFAAYFLLGIVVTIITLTALGALDQ